MDITPLLKADPAIQFHVFFAVIALFLGAAVLWRRKGGWLHKVMGRIWVFAMVMVSLSGFFIHEIQVWGDFSPIHFFSISVPLSLLFAVRAARRGDIQAHKSTMKATYVGGMVIAGGFTFLPGRLNHDVFFGGSTLDVFEQAGGYLLPLVAAAIVAIAFGLWSRKGAGQNSTG